MKRTAMQQAAHELLNLARDGGDVSRDAITMALKATGDLPPNHDGADDEDDSPIERVHRGVGEWEGRTVAASGPATWMCGLDR